MTRGSDDDDGVGAAVVQAAEDAKAYAAAQVALYREMAAARFRVAKGGLVFGAVAAVLGLAAVNALVVGLILALVPLVGALLATLIVVGVVVATAGLLGWLAARRFADALGPIE